MDIFAQNKVLLRLVVALIVLNIAAITGMWWVNSRSASTVENARRPEPQAERLIEVLRENLELRPEQVDQFRTIRKSFFEKERVLATTIRAGRDSMNTLMFRHQTDSALVRAVARRVADNEYIMELLRIEQAEQLKQVCTPEQQQRFENYMREIRDYLKPVKP